VVLTGLPVVVVVVLVDDKMVNITGGVVVIVVAFVIQVSMHRAIKTKHEVHVN